MAKNTRTSERKCRKNIKTLLSLMGFKDDDPVATVKAMRAKLRQIEERAKFKKRDSPSRKLKLKCGGKTAILSLKPTTPQSSETTLVVCNGNVDRNVEIRGSRKIMMCSENSPSCSKPMINDNVDREDDDVRMELNNNGEYMVLVGSSNCNVVQEENPLPGRIKDLMNFITSVGGSRFKLLIQKKLTSTDVTKQQGRLLIPKTNVENSGILREIEKRKLGNGKDISIPVFDPKRRECKVNLKRWKMSKSVYALKTGWNAIVDTNGLEEGMVIQVWSFRVNHEELCLAIIRV